MVMSNDFGIEIPMTRNKVTCPFFPCIYANPFVFSIEPELINFQIIYILLLFLKKYEMRNLRQKNPDNIFAKDNRNIHQKQ